MSSTPKNSHFQTPRGSGGMNTPSIAHANSAIRNVNKRKRAAFKGSLDSSFDIRWPFVPAQEQAEVLEMLLALFTPMGEFRRSRLKISTTMKRSDNQEVSTPKASKRKLPNDTSLSPESMNKPEQLDNIVFGIKEITKHLESALDLSVGHRNPKDRLRIIFVCKADVSPSILVNHLLLLAAQTGIAIFPLGKNAEQALALAMGVTRVTAVGIKEGTPIFDQLCSVATSKVSTVDSNWIFRKTNFHEKSIKAA